MISSYAPEWQRLVRELKLRPQEESLTPSQRVAFDLLVHATAFPQWVNLYGPAGSGKTFVAWALARATGATHLSVPEHIVSLAAGADCVLIDNAPVREEEVRRVLAHCDMQNARTVVLITQRQVQMPMQQVLLDLPTDSDWNAIEHTFQRLGAILPPNRAPDLWAFLRGCSH